MNEIMLVYITMPDEKEAVTLATSLLEKRLAACITMTTGKSMYWWHGKIMDENERLLFVKTTPALIDQLQKEVLAQHPHDIPCIITMPCATHEEFSSYVAQETK